MIAFLESWGTGVSRMVDAPNSVTNSVTNSDTNSDTLTLSDKQRRYWPIVL